MRSSSLDHVVEREALWETLRIQSRVIGALTLREIRSRFGRDNIGFFWIVAEPAFFCMAVVVFWSFVGHGDHAQIGIAPFLLLGYMPLQVFRHTTNRLLRCMQFSTAFLYHRQVTVFSIYVSRILVEILGIQIAFFLCALGFYLFGYMTMPENFGLMLVGWILYCWHSIGVAIAIGALSERSELVEKFWGPISYIMIPLSGTFYMVDWIPAAFRAPLMLFPQVNCVEMIRGGYFGLSVQVYYNMPYVAFVNATILLIGLFLLKDARKYVEVE